MLYQFEHDYMKFSEGGLDEKLMYDRYSTPEHRIENISPGDVVVCKIDRKTDKRIIGVVVNKNDIENVVVETRTQMEEGLLEETKTFHHELLTKPMDLLPSDYWYRWAKAGASVEDIGKRLKIENDFRWLFDGFRFSTGGRIQLMAGQEYVIGDKAALTAFNCFVIPSPEYLEENWQQAAEDSFYALKAMLAVVDTGINEAQIMARGGGVGYNASTIPPKIKGAAVSKYDILLYLPDEHLDSDILRELDSIGKFDGVLTADRKPKYDNNYSYLKVEDSREGLLNGIKWMIQEAYEGHKVFVDFSDIRHKGALVKGVNGRSSGAPSWMALYNTVAKMLSQEYIDAIDTMELQTGITLLIEQGGSRRGALMIVLHCYHPNIREFITRKQTSGNLTGANISVGVTNEFMEKAKIEGTTENITWKLIIESAWKSAEPGLLFMEVANAESNSWYVYPLIATNPCGEQFLPAWAVCNLGHLVLSRFYNEAKNDVDWSALAKACALGVRFQDNMIDYTDFFIEENRKQQLSERRVGMGSMGLATLLIKLGIRYGSPESLEFIDKLFMFIAKEAYKTSIDIAEEKGAFPVCDPQKMAQSGFMKRMMKVLEDEMISQPEGLVLESYADKFYRVGIRNITILTQAPTGSTGTTIDNLLMQYDDGTSTGIEPYFAFEYYRASRSGFAKQEVKLVQLWKDKNPGKELPDFFVTAQDLSPEDHIRVQAAIQKWVDSSISKTANCPSSFTVEDTRKLYELAYELGCKGVTIYRDGSRDAQVLSTDKDKAKLESDYEEEKLKEMQEEREIFEQIGHRLNSDKHVELKVGESIWGISEPKPKFDIQKRPKRLYGFTEKVHYVYGDKSGRAYVTINLQDGEPWEVFISTKNKEVSSLAKALGLMTTKLLRLGGASDNIQQAIDTLTYDQVMGTLPYVVANILKQLQKDKLQTVMVETKKNSLTMAKCPDCGEQSYDKANCICGACGVSKCN